MSDDDLSEDIPLADLAATAQVQRDIKRSEARIEEMAKRRRLMEPPVPAAASTAEQVWAFLSGTTSSGAGVDVMSDLMDDSEKPAYFSKLRTIDRASARRFFQTNNMMAVRMFRGYRVHNTDTIALPYSLVIEMNALNSGEIATGSLARFLTGAVKGPKGTQDVTIVIETDSNEYTFMLHTQDDGTVVPWLVGARQQ
jgi:hypothetical protein